MSECLGKVRQGMGRKEAEKVNSRAGNVSGMDKC